MMIAKRRQQDFSIRQTACVLHRSPSTVSRELTRSSEQGAYASANAQQSFCQRRCHIRPRH